MSGAEDVSGRKCVFDRVFTVRKSADLIISGAVGNGGRNKRTAGINSDSGSTQSGFTGIQNTVAVSVVYNPITNTGGGIGGAVTGFLVGA